jgi:hypothetical protein
MTAQTDATGEPDPVFEHLRATEHARRAIEASPDPSDAAIDPLVDAWCEAETRLYGTVPTTAAGLAALIAYVRSDETDGDFPERAVDGRVVNLGWTLEAAARRLAGQPDPAREVCPYYRDVPETAAAAAGG